ncbi:MAG TPA: hypothetical protein VJT09_19355 [Pyrinomonadaceae bacterium]|nr:hypothetical protein [Pyrinomonadaceae bacterium]
MEKGISEIVGRAHLDGGRSVEIYRALRSLLCATCGTEIPEGTLFTRRRVKGVGVRIMPQCRKCAPFNLQAGKKEKSALLQSLMSGAQADSPGRAGTKARAATDDVERQRDEKNLEEEVRRRLGPALKRKSGGDRK